MHRMIWEIPHYIWLPSGDMVRLVFLMNRLNVNAQNDMGNTPLLASKWGYGKIGLLHALIYFLYPPQTLFVVGILFSHCPCVRSSETFCFLNN